MNRLSLTSPPSRFAAIRTVAGAILVATIIGCGLSLTIALVSIRLDAAGFSGRAIGINTAAGGFATLIGAPAIPWAARTLGVARLLMASLVLGGFALFAFTLSDDYNVWLALRFILGLVVTIEFVLSEFWITSWAPDGHRGLAIGLYSTCLAAGFALGPAILGWVGTAGNLPFYVGAGLFMGAAMPLAFNARGAPPLEVRGTKTLLAFLREAPAATLAALMQGAIEVAGMGLLPVYAHHAGLGVTDGVLLASTFILGSSMLQLPLGALADRFDRYKLLIGIAVLGVAGAVILAWIGVADIWVFEIVLFVWGGLVGGLYPVGLSQLAAMYRDADLASANSAFVMAYAIGMLAGPPLIGAGLDLAPAGFFWMIAGLLSLYLLVSVLHLVGDRKPHGSFP